MDLRGPVCRSGLKPILPFRRGVSVKKARLHHFLEQVGTIAFPGVYDTLSAKICQMGGLLADRFGGQ